MSATIMLYGYIVVFNFSQSEFVKWQIFEHILCFDALKRIISIKFRIGYMMVLIDNVIMIMITNMYIMIMITNISLWSLVNKGYKVLILQINSIVIIRKRRWYFYVSWYSPICVSGVIPR